MPKRVVNRAFTRYNLNRASTFGKELSGTKPLGVTMSDQFPIIDSHVHVAPNWYEPVESLLFHMDTVGVDKAILVQQQGQFDNRYLLECAWNYADRLYAVVLVDVKRADAVDQLQELAEQGAHGIRLRPTDRSSGVDPLAIWHQAEA